MTKKIHWNDLQDGTSSELKRTYKMNARELEKAVRYHLDGATQPERRKIYEVVYGKR